MLQVSFRSFAIAVSLISLTVGLSRDAAADEADAKIKPVRALLVLGGCCHDYKAQMDLLAKGISERAHVEVVIALDKDTSTAHLNPVYEKANWAEGFDVIIHDECSSDVKDLAIIDRILEPHRQGLPAVLLHCGMHHPVTKGLADWTTVNEELYNNSEGKLLDTATAVALGQQKGATDAAVVWTNNYREKTRVFATTLGHNNATVADPKYLDLVTRGLLWSCDRLDEKHLKAK